MTIFDGSHGRSGSSGPTGEGSSGPAGKGRGGAPEGRLDPTRDPQRWERSVAAVLDAAAPELARRRRATPLVPERWAGPLLAAAASLMIVASGGLLWSASRSPGEAEGPIADAVPAFEEALYPAVVASWLGGRLEPTVEDLAFASLEEP